MKQRYAIFTLVILILLALGLTVQAQGDNTLIVAAKLDDIITLDPGRAFETVNLIIFHAAYETLLEIPADDLTQIVPALAESYTVSDDGLVYTFVIREGATFASGNPVTAASKWSTTGQCR
jgi:peptide/nickel transport system substrate-binding protein